MKIKNLLALLVCLVFTSATFATNIIKADQIDQTTSIDKPKAKIPSNS